VHNQSGQKETENHQGALTLDRLLLAYRLLYGEGGQKLLEIYQRGENTNIELGDVAGDWDVDITDYKGFPFSFEWVRIVGGVWIQIEEDVTAAEGAQLLHKALTHDALGLHRVHKHLSEEERIELNELIRSAQVKSAAAAWLNGAKAVEVTGSVLCEPADWGIMMAEIANGNYAAAIGALPAVPAGWSAVLRKTEAGETMIDLVKGSKFAEGLNSYVAQRHHIVFRILDGTDEAHNLIKMHHGLHTASGQGVHQHIVDKLGLDSIQQLGAIWDAAFLSGKVKAQKRVAQDLLDAYRSYFKRSADADDIIAIFKEAIEKETGLTLK